MFLETAEYFKTFTVNGEIAFIVYFPQTEDLIQQGQSFKALEMENLLLELSPYWRMPIHLLAKFFFLAIVIQCLFPHLYT